MVSNVVSDNEVLDLSIFGKLHKDLLIKVLKVVDCTDELTLRDVHPVCFSDCGIRVLVQVLEDHRLGEWWFVVESGAGVAMTARANLEVEGTIDLVLLGSKNLSESFCHSSIFVVG